jgi:hypothetical protein
MATATKDLYEILGVSMRGSTPSSTPRRSIPHGDAH